MGVTVDGPGGGDRPPPRDIGQERIDRLETLRVGRSPLDVAVRTNLAAWVGPGAPEQILIRPGFARRLLPLIEGVEYDPAVIADRPKPKLARQPTLAALAPLTKGVALPLCVTLPLLVQTQPRKALGKDALLKIAIEGSDDQLGLIDLIAIPASHHPSEETAYVSNSRENRKRQIRNGFVQLDQLGVVELPLGGRKGAPRFNIVYLNEESRPTASGAKRYTTPRSTAKVVSIPIDFYLNGWVHALSKSELAMWLMLRDLHQRNDIHLPPNHLHIRGRNRLLQYDLSRAVWDTHSALEDFGLIAVHKDPNRRANGTTIDGERALPHYFELSDEGLRADGLSTVINALTERQSGTS